MTAMTMLGGKASSSVVASIIRPVRAIGASSSSYKGMGKILPLRCSPVKTESAFYTMQNKAFCTSTTMHQLTKSKKELESSITGEEYLTAVSVLGGSSALLEVTCSSGRRLKYPILWFRVQCQCSECYSKLTESRTLVMQDWSVSDAISSCNITPNGGLAIDWANGHHSELEASWLLERAFKEEVNEKRRIEFHLPKKLWNENHELPRYTYESLFEDDRILLEVIQEIEVNGGVYVTNASSEMDSGYNLAEHISIAKKTNFGNMCNLYPTQGATNLAYTTKPLDLHTDLVFYEETPGVLLLHALTQHKGIGGDTVLSDGFKVAKIMRHEHPKEFKILTTANVFFRDRGVDTNSETQSDFSYNKLTRGPIINLDSNNDVAYIRASNHLLDSFIDIPVDKVTEFYQAYKLFYELNLKHSVNFKLGDGDMVIADNHRVLHGRATVHGDSSRHLVATYITWDEVRCKRRRLQEKFPDVAF